MPIVRYASAGSSGLCNKSIKSFGWGFESQSLAWSFVELPSHFVELGLRVHGQVSPLSAAGTVHHINSRHEPGTQAVGK